MPPYSLNLDGSGDNVESNTFYLEGYSWVSLMYQWEMGGGASGDKPEAGDDLLLQFHFGQGWETVKSHFGRETRTDMFMVEEVPLPELQGGQEFRFRFSTSQGDGANQDDWFIDDIKLVAGTSENPVFLSDDFESGPLSFGDWEVQRGSSDVNDAAHNPPSASHSLNLDGESDIIATKGYNLAFMFSARLTFYWEQGDGVGNDKPETGDDLYADILLPWGWFPIFHQVQSNNPDTSFTNFSCLLPRQALHSNFRLRFRVTSDEGAGKDDWFIDDISISEHMDVRKNIGIYLEYSEYESEGINPIMALYERYPYYNLDIFNDYGELADNLLELDLLIIAEQKHMSAGTAQNIATQINDILESFMERGGKIIVLDGGEGEGRDLVGSFITSSASQSTYGTIKKADPLHPLCVNITNSFQSVTSTAYFEVLDGRIVFTRELGFDVKPVVVEKRFALGSVILFGFDFSDWNEDVAEILYNSLHWNIINTFSVQPPVIDDNHVFAGKGPFQISVNVTDTIGPDDVTGVELDLFPTAEKIVYTGSEAHISGSGNITLDSWYKECSLENLLLHFNVTFGWGFSTICEIDVNVTANSRFLPPAINSMPGLFTYDNEIKFSGELVVLNEQGREINDGDYVRGGEVLTFTGLNVVYNSSTNVTPPQSEFGVEILCADGGYWIDDVVSPTGIFIQVEAPAMDSYEESSYLLNISGPASSYMVGGNRTFNVLLDHVAPQFQNGMPQTGAWLRNANVNCSVEINETDGSGMNVENVTCRYSVNAGFEWSEWQSVDGFSEGRAWKLINFSEGMENVLEWRASDMVGNENVLEIENIWLDHTPVTFIDYYPLEIHYVSEMPADVECGVNVVDQMSGINEIDSWVRQRMVGEEWGDWVPAQLNDQGGQISLIHTLTFEEDSDMQIQWLCRDVAGNGNMSQVLNVTAQVPVTIESPSVSLLMPLNSSITDEHPTISWSLVDNGDMGMWVVVFDIFMANISELDVINDTHLIATTDSTTYDILEKLDNGTVYYWTVIPRLIVEGTELELKGTCREGYFEFMVIKEFVAKMSFNVSVSFDNDGRAFEQGEIFNVYFTVNNLGTNPDTYSLKPNDDWNYTVIEPSILRVDSGEKEFFTVVLVLSQNHTIGTHFINITIKSVTTGNEILMVENITIVAKGLQSDDDTLGDDDGQTLEDANQTSPEKGFFSNMVLIYVGIGVVLLLIIIGVIVKRSRDYDDYDDDDYDDDYDDEDYDEDYDDDDDIFSRIRKDVGIAPDVENKKNSPIEKKTTSVPSIQQKDSTSYSLPTKTTDLPTKALPGSKPGLLTDDVLNELLKKAAMAMNGNESQSKTSPAKPPKIDIYEELSRDGAEGPISNRPPKGIDEVSSVDELLDDIVVVSSNDHPVTGPLDDLSSLPLAVATAMPLADDDDAIMDVSDRVEMLPPPPE